MKRPLSRWRQTALSALLAACLRVSGYAQETANEFWPELNAFVKLNEGSRLFLLGSGTRIAEQGNTDGSLGAHLDIFSSAIFKHRVGTAQRADVARHKLLQVRIGYLYSRAAKSSSSQFSEHTPTLEFSPRFYFPKHLLITNRLRGDFRFLDGVFTPRLRYRMKVERTFKAGGHALTPYFHTEAFYDWRYNAWHRFRYSAGVEWELSRRVVIEGYYLRQRDNRASTKYVNAVGIGLQLYFR